MPLTIAIYGSRHFEQYAEPVYSFLAALEQAGAEVVMHRKIYDILLHFMPKQLAIVRRVVSTTDFKADLALSIGGDGTFLRTAMWVGSKGIPILGVNAGHLGFLASASVGELPSLVPQLLAPEHAVEPRSLIQVDAPQVPVWPYALNEVVVSKEVDASMITARTYIGGHHLADYRADGLLVSTPTGSTAYNLSAGGPILEPSAPVWAITPIAAHALGMRPLVVSDSSQVAVSVEARSATFRLTLDGRSCSLPIGSEVRMAKAPFAINLLSISGHTFAQALREKLHWSE